MDKLKDKIRILNEHVWNHSVPNELLNKWLNNFFEEEKLFALYIASKFMFISEDLLRTLLNTLFIELVKRPIASKLRKDSQLFNSEELEEKWKIELNKIRFLGLGNPSESGVFLLYFFRQMNGLSKNLFVAQSDLIDLEKSQLKENVKDIEHLIFLDDICGSGTQADIYASAITKQIKKINGKIYIQYLVIVGLHKGLKDVRDKRIFDQVDALIELDDSYNVFNNNSRFFHKDSELCSICEFVKSCTKQCLNMCKKIMEKYGKNIKDTPMGKEEQIEELGFKNLQQLFGMFYNIPNITLPVIWADTKDWHPLFKRYMKKWR